MKTIGAYLILFLNISTLHATRLHWVDQTAKVANPPQKEISSRLTWTDELEEAFADALNFLGEAATPAQILTYMKDAESKKNLVTPNKAIMELTRTQVSSHLQKYRNKSKKAQALATEVTQKLNNEKLLGNDLNNTEIILSTPEIEDITNNINEDKENQGPHEGKIDFLVNYETEDSHKLTVDHILNM